MADNINDNDKPTEVVGAESVGRASNAISKGTLIMIAGTALFLIIAAILFSRFFSAPTGTAPGSTGSTTTGTNR